MEHALAMFREVGFIGDRPAPTVPVRLYRGVSVPSAVKRGLSWTGDLQRAIYFAGPHRLNRYGDGWVYAVLAPPEAVLARFNDRDEDEYLLDPHLLPRVRQVGTVTEDGKMRWARGIQPPDVAR